MSTVYLTVGIPASGKTTWAVERVKNNDNLAIVSRDDIRIMQGLKHGENENLVTVVHRAMIEGLLLEGKDVIVADTNINPKFRRQLIKFCHEHGADVELVPFPISLDTAIIRDANRPDTVGADVVSRMHQQFSEQKFMDQELSFPVPTYHKHEHHPDRPPAIVVDIDGTLAKMNGRSPYDESRVKEDTYVKAVGDAIIGMSAQTGAQIIVVSGRTDKCYNDTFDWLVDNGFPFDHLFMRKAGDQRPDYIVKNEIYDASITPYNSILAVFDDRDQVVRHLRKRGITVFQVAPGRF